MAKLQSDLDAIAARDDDNIIKRRLDELPEVPVGDWDELVSKVKAGTFEIREMSVYPGDFGLFAAPGEYRVFELLRLLTLIVPAAALLAAFFLSAWALILIPLAFLPLQGVKRIYRRVLADTALSSESVFSFLFSRNLIFLHRHNDKPVYRDNRED